MHFLERAKMHTLGFGLREFEAIFCCSFICFEVQLQWLFYVYLSNLIADDKVINVESTVDLVA